MNKMNKKGFTLIEMLVVIAIIAVLVSIIIPTVTSATDKAAAATNAANLRSVKAEVTTAMLTNDDDICEVTRENGKVTAVKLGDKASKPNAKSCGGLEVNKEKGLAPSIEWDAQTEQILVYYGNKANTIDAFAKVAAGEAKANDTIKAAG